MFDFAWSHFALLFAVSIILLGPKEIPVVLRWIGRWVGKIRHHKAEFQEYFETIASHDAPSEGAAVFQQDSVRPSSPQIPVKQSLYKGSEENERSRL